MTGTTTDMAIACSGDTGSDDSGSTTVEIISSVCGMLLILHHQSLAYRYLHPQPMIAANYSIFSIENSTRLVLFSRLFKSTDSTVQMGGEPSVPHPEKP